MVSQHRTFGVDRVQLGTDEWWLVVETEYELDVGEDRQRTGFGKLVPVSAMEWARASSEWRARTIAKALTDTLGEWK